MERAAWRDEPRRSSARRAVCGCGIRALDAPASRREARHHRSMAGQRTQPPQPAGHVSPRFRLRRGRVATAGPADPGPDRAGGAARGWRGVTALELTSIASQRVKHVGNAHILPSARIYTLDLGGPDVAQHAQLELTDPELVTHWDRGERFRGTPEGRGITQLFGDSATFDFSPYEQKMDLVYIDASHSYSYVRSDTEAALGMISELGTIVWDDYTGYSGVFAYLNELAPGLDGPIFHLLDTRLALYSRWPVVVTD